MKDIVESNSGLRGLKSRYVYPLLFVLALTRPFPVEFFGTISVRIIDVLISLLILLFLQFHKKEITVNYANSLLLKGITLFSVFYLIATLLHVDQNTIASIPELFRFFLVFPFALLGSYWAKQPHFYQTFKNALTIVVVGVVGIAILQFVFNGTPIDVLYATTARLEEFSVHNRSIGLYWNPNIFSFVLLSLLAINLCFVKGKYLEIYIILGVFISGSRTGLGILLLLYLVYLFRKPGLIHKLSVIAGLALLFALIIFAKDIPAHSGTPWFRIVDGLKAITCISENTSMMGKLGYWKLMLPYVHESLWIGHGPMRAVITSSTDNYYLYLLVRSGLVGVAFYFLFMWGILYLGYKVYKYSSYVEYLNSTLLLILFVSVANIVSEVFIVMPVMVIIFTWYGILSEKCDRKENVRQAV